MIMGQPLVHQEPRRKFASRPEKFIRIAFRKRTAPAENPNWSNVSVPEKGNLTRAHLFAIDKVALVSEYPAARKQLIQL